MNKDYHYYAVRRDVPVKRQRGSSRHSSQRRAADRHESGGKLIGWTGFGVMWNSSTSSDDELWSVQTTLLTADARVSGKVPCQHHRRLDRQPGRPPPERLIVILIMKKLSTTTSIGVAIKNFGTELWKFYGNWSFFYDNVFVCNLDASLAQNKSKSRLTPSFVLQLTPCFVLDEHTQAVLEITKRRKLILVSSKKLDHNW